MRKGDHVGGYVLERLMGEGGLGCVYRAHRDRDGAVAAVKVLKESAARQLEHQRRFEREARAAREVAHPRLVEVLDTGVDAGRRYIACRLVDGPSLSERLRAAGPLAVEEAVALIAQVASAVDALHGAGLVHRDVKPSNVLLDPVRGAVLTDFGLAKRETYTAITASGQVVGTIGYLAPEVLIGEQPGQRADIYGVGCIAFECLAGRPPFSGSGPFELSWAHLSDRPPDPCADRSDAPAGLGRFVLTALEKDPAARPPTASAYARLLLASIRRG